MIAMLLFLLGCVAMAVAVAMADTVATVYRGAGVAAVAKGGSLLGLGRRRVLGEGGARRAFVGGSTATRAHGVEATRFRTRRFGWDQ